MKRAKRIVSRLGTIGKMTADIATELKRSMVIIVTLARIDRQEIGRWL
jgi:hypothetical protein